MSHCLVESNMSLMDINTHGVNIDSYKHLKDLLDQQGQWDVDLLNHLFP